jgi:hypothetical protein
MIKSLNKNDVLVTPFEAQKTWETNNLNPLDLILWMSQSIDLSTGITSSLTGTIALTYIDYGDNSVGYPITNSFCSLALQQQDSEYIIYQKGTQDFNVLYPTASFYDASSKFYTASENPRNIDGTYTSIIYESNKHLFYNGYNNFTKTFGMESADLTETNRLLTDNMDVFTIPQSKFGEKIIPNSLKMFDSSLDREYVILDDGKCNLIFSGSVFSKYEMNSLLDSKNQNISFKIHSIDCNTSASYEQSAIYTSPFGLTDFFFANSRTITTEISGGIAPYTIQWYIEGDFKDSWTLTSQDSTTTSVTYNTKINNLNNVDYANTYVICQLIDADNHSVFSNIINLTRCA